MGGCLASDKGGNDFLAFKDLFYLLIIRAMPTTSLKGSEQSWDSRQIKLKTEKSLTGRPVSIFVIMAVRSKHSTLNPILLKLTCN